MRLYVHMRGICVKSNRSDVKSWIEHAILIKMNSPSRVYTHCVYVYIYTSVSSVELHLQFNTHHHHECHHFAILIDCDCILIIDLPRIYLILLLYTHTRCQSLWIRVVRALWIRFYIQVFRDCPKVFLFILRKCISFHLLTLSHRLSFARTYAVGYFVIFEVQLRQSICQWDFRLLHISQECGAVCDQNYKRTQLEMNGWKFLHSPKIVLFLILVMEKSWNNSF